MLKHLNRIEEYFLGISLAIMVVINFGNVLSRYFLHASWSFTEEILIILFVYNSLLGSAVAFKYGAHIGLSVLTDLFPEKLKKCVVIVSALLTISLMLILMKYGVEMVMTQKMYGQITPVLGMPEWISGLAIPIGAILIIFRIIQRSYLFIKGREMK